MTCLEQVALNSAIRSASLVSLKNWCHDVLPSSGLLSSMKHATQLSRCAVQVAVQVTVQVAVQASTIVTGIATA